MAQKPRLTIKPKKAVKSPLFKPVAKEIGKDKKRKRLYKPKVRLTAHIRHG